MEIAVAAVVAASADPHRVEHNVSLDLVALQGLGIRGVGYLLLQVQVAEYPLEQRHRRLQLDRDLQQTLHRLVQTRLQRGERDNRPRRGRP